VNLHILQIPARFLLTDQFLIRLSRQVVQRRYTGQETFGNLQAGSSVSSIMGAVSARRAGDDCSLRWEDGAMEIRSVELNGNGNRNIPGTGDAHVMEVVRQAHDELRQLMRQRAEIMKRIGTVKQTIVGLANLFGDEILSEELLDLVDRKSGGRQPGFTKACRMVLMEAKRPLAAREVCEEIQRRVPPLLARHKDPLASVTTVLNRLVEYGEARSTIRENGRRAWEWVADPADSTSEERGLARA